MKFTDLLSLLPIIAIATAGVVLMLIIALRRDYILAWKVAMLGVAVSLLSVPIAWQTAPIMVTPLIIIDDYALFFSALFFVAGGIVLVFCRDYFSLREGENEELFLLILFALLGAVTLVCSVHFASFFIGLETLSVSLFALIAYPIRERRALEAAIKYFILSGVSSAFLLFGIALIYAELGTLSFTETSRLLGDFSAQSITFIGIIMVLVALGFKLSLAPFHMWTSDVYEGAPAPVTAFVATVSKGAVFALLLRFFVSADVIKFTALYSIMAMLAIATIMVGNLLALLQNNVKRILAYSSIAHLGYLLVAFTAGLAIDIGLLVESVMYYLVVYILTTLGSFGIVTALSSAQREAETLEDYSGLFWEQPLLASLFTVMLLSLAGIPLTAGFIAKFYVFAAGVHAQYWLLLFTVVIGSGIGLFYYLRIVLQMAKQPNDKPGKMKLPQQIARIDKLALSILTVLIFWFGIAPSGLIDWLASVSKTLA